MKTTIYSKAINNGEQHVLSVPFLGTFTVDQRDRNRAIAFIHSNNKGGIFAFSASITHRELAETNCQKGSSNPRDSMKPTCSLIRRQLEFGSAYGCR